MAIWPAAEAYATSVSSSLKAVQSPANGWQTALMAILGLVTVVSLVGGRSTVQMLSGAMQAWIVIFAAVAVAANARGIYKSTLASIGFPAIKRAKSALELSNCDLWPLQQTIHAVSNLHSSEKPLGMVPAANSPPEFSRSAGRQSNQELGVAGDRLDLQVPVMRVHHDPPGGVESESGALAHRLGGEERLEYPVRISGGTPGPVSPMTTTT